MYLELAILSVFVFLYSSIARGLERIPVSGPIVFVFTGCLLGPLGLGWLSSDLTSQQLRVLADLTLALVLFLDAANANVRVLVRFREIPQRMLLLGLPGAIALGFVFGWLIFDDLGLYEVAVLAVMLAATDAALGKAVITNPSVPARVREGLNVESGLNDGICVPILFVFIALAQGRAGDEGGGTALALKLVTKEIGIGLAVGLGLAAMGAGVLRFCHERGWLNEIWQQLPVIGLAIASFAVAQSLHGSGYIAAFSGGLLFGILARESTHELVLAAEGTAELFALLTWVLFGAAVVPLLLDRASWDVILYALLSLTVIRVAPIFLSLTGSGESTENKLFMGWFGPRGLASVVFAIIVVNAELPGAELLAVVVGTTVFFSVIAHGLTASPLASRLGQGRSSVEAP